ncbi:DUF4233 domain-containing protein [Haloechinothrix sp. LS1_15]|uniref:DUF4233 domain-containing protein n=1 Tax=Haloechinothrix sp. LS1_15 TaxID=2652248 RepID=UPI002948AC65|nr:DUF4233 domain-containing protein [Haloechinothrix sp. LS1_15]MDV6012035.1 DUF4233 domain-containing protein [Haloechinothrix sp. LS1_15]
MGEGSTAQPIKDPMRSFRGVMAGALILQVIVVGLALLVVADLGEGVTSWQGWALFGVLAGLIACCGLLRYRWVVAVVFVLQAVLVAFLPALPAIGVVGLLFAGAWIYMLWLRRVVARRMAEGTLPGQQA